MEQRGISQAALALETGLAQGTVGKLCRGHFTAIHTNTLTTLCEYFGLKSISELIEIEDDD